jgi:hypothetical protein
MWAVYKEIILMNCPKCSGGIVGFTDGTLKCTDCTWIGREAPSPATIEWARSIATYLNTQPLEEVRKRGDIKVLVSHAFAYGNKTPPPEAELDKFLDVYIEHREKMQVSL